MLQIDFTIKNNRTNMAIEKAPQLFVSYTKRNQENLLRLLSPTKKIPTSVGFCFQITILPSNKDKKCLINSLHSTLSVDNIDTAIVADPRKSRTISRETYTMNPATLQKKIPQNNHTWMFFKQIKS